MKRGKYGNVPTEADGFGFDSKAELTRYRELRLLEKGGVIYGLKVHPVYQLQPAFSARGKSYRAIEYEGDFSYIENDSIVVEDVKAMRTAVFNLKEKLFRFHYPGIDFRIVNVKRPTSHESRGSNGRPRMVRFSRQGYRG